MGVWIARHEWLAGKDMIARAKRAGEWLRDARRDRPFIRAVLVDTRPARVLGGSRLSVSSAEFDLHPDAKSFQDLRRPLQGDSVIFVPLITRDLGCMDPKAIRQFLLRNVLRDPQ